MGSIEFNQALKVNLHNHTKRSDGEFSVDELSELYREQGYSALAITDHRIYYSKKHHVNEIEILSGCEYNCYLETKEYGQLQFHLLTLKINDQDNGIPHDDNSYKSLFYNELSDVQALIDELKSRGNIVLIAHPKNPMIPLSIMQALKADGFEVFNQKAESDATDYVNSLFRFNRTIIYIASDDSHWAMDAMGRTMFFQGHIVLEEGMDTITQIRKGRFYSSNGVKIHSIYWGDRKVKVDADAMSIEVIFMLRDGSVITLLGKEVKIPTGAEAFYIVCLKEGKKAWSNILIL